MSTVTPRVRSAAYCAQQVADVAALRLLQQIRAQIGGPDRVRFLEDELLPGIVAGRRHPERERQQEGQQAERRADDRAHRRILLVVRALASVVPQAPARLGREQNNRHGDDVERPERQRIADSHQCP